MTVLQARQLTLHAGDKLLCERLDWQCAPGEIWAVLGRNGVGKTTLLHSLAGIRACTAPQCQGEILLHGQALANWSRRQIAQQLGLLLQDYHDPFPGTVMEYVLMGRHPYLHALQWESAQDAVGAVSHGVAVGGFRRTRYTKFVRRRISTHAHCHAPGAGPADPVTR